MLTDDGGEVFGGIAHLGFEEAGPGEVVGIGLDSDFIGELGGVEGVFGHIFGREVRGEVVLEKMRDLHFHGGGEAAVVLGGFVPGAGIDAVAAGDFEGFGEGLNGGGGGEIGGDLDDGGGGGLTEVDDFARGNF